jgi:hypothetical protein
MVTAFLVGVEVGELEQAVARNATATRATDSPHIRRVSLSMASSLGVNRDLKKLYFL